MADKKVINFEDAKSSHVFKRKEDKVLSIQKAFTAARTDGDPVKKKLSKKGKKGKKKK